MKRLFSLVLLACLPAVAFAKDDLAKYAGIYKGETRAKGETRVQGHQGDFAIRHHTMTLSLGADGTATLSQSPDAEHEITSFAHWTHEGDLIKLNFDPVDKQPTPTPMTFKLDHKTLTAATYDHSLWRTLPPPQMKRMKQHDSDDDL